MQQPRPAAASEGAGQRTTVCYPFVGDTLGGSHLSTLALICGLDASRWEPVIVVHEEGPLTQYLRRQQMSFRVLPLRAYAGRQRGVPAQLRALWRCFWPLKTFLRENSVRIVHTQDARMHTSWALPARTGGLKFVWHQRTAFAASRLTRYLLPLSHRIITISDWAAGTMPSWATRSATVIPNPVMAATTDDEVARKRSAILTQGGATEPAIVIGTVGNLRELKQPLTLIEVGAALSHRLGGTLVCVSLGEDRENWEPRMRARAAELGIEERLVLLGFKQPAEPWIGAFDLLLAPSSSDAFGRTLVEAMQLGVPVVATDAGGHREVVVEGKTGLLTPLGDIAAMSEAAHRILSDPGLAKRLTDSACKQARARFSISTHATAVERVYSSMLGGFRAETVPR